jgi:hypothetical protein
MARRTKVWTADYGRDAGKRFLITELPADAAERWAVKLLLAIAGANPTVPEGTLQSGMAGVASMLKAGVQSLQGLTPDVVQPLLDEMMACVQFLPEIPGQPHVQVPPRPLNTGENSQMEEVRTRFAIRMEVLELHLGFSLAAVVSSTRATPATAAPN